MAVVDVDKETGTKHKDLDELIDHIGGCSIYQWLTCCAIHLVKLCTVWSNMTMVYAGQNPGFICKAFKVNNISSVTFNISDVDVKEACYIDGDESNVCTEFIFDDKESTIVSEWSLVCNRSWIVSLITSLQMFAMACACLSIGYVSDLYGRRPVYKVSIFATIVLNIVGVWSGNWKVYLVVRTLIGFAIGSITTVQYNLMIEVVPPRWRSLVVTMPSTPLAACLFALLSWGSQDWKKIHIATAISGVPIMCASCFLSESIRWLVSKKKIAEVEDTVERIAKINRAPTFNVDVCEYFTPDKQGDKLTKNGPILEILKSKRMFIQSAGLCIAWYNTFSMPWFAIGLGGIGYVFGVGVLPGNLYLNMLFLTLPDVVLGGAFGALSDRYGRNRIIFILLLISGICGLSVGITQAKVLDGYTDVMNSVAYVAKVTNGAASGVLTVYALELFPTNLRSTGYGLTYTAGRLGAVLAPYIIQANASIPGLLYNLVSSFTLLASVVIYFLPETKDVGLEHSNKDGILITVKK